MKNKSIAKVTIYPGGDVNVFTKFHSSPSNAGQDISLKNTNVTLMMVLDEKPEDRQSPQASSSWGR